MTDYEELIQRQIGMCKGNVKLIRERIEGMDNQYLKDTVLLTEACGGFGDSEFEIIGFEYLNGYPTLITNKKQNGLSGNGMNTNELKLILDSLLDSDTLCINIGFSNNNKEDIQGILNCIPHNSYDLKSEETKQIYSEYAFELLV